jgi:protein Mpv17
MAVWPLANAVNFAIVPAPYRVLYVNFVSLCWNTYLSSVNAASARANTHTHNPQQLELGPA